MRREDSPSDQGLLHVPRRRGRGLVAHGASSPPQASRGDAIGTTDQVAERHLDPSFSSWPEIPGMIQMVLATFVPTRGWLTTKRSVIYGGHHGEPPMITKPEKAFEIMQVELRSGLIAMKHRLDSSQY